MEFVLYPILAKMRAFYELPLNSKRFQVYLNMLHEGKKGDMRLPIGAYNPMAREHVLKKILELEAIGSEQIVSEALKEVNEVLMVKNLEKDLIKVVINIADDLKGGWTNRFATDFDSKFKINALVNRNFCTPYFWSSEDYSPELIRKRTCEYAFRTAYWKKHTRLKTLEDHFNQEVFVAKRCNNKEQSRPPAALKEISAFYERYRDSEDYSLIFNFFYGDEVSQSLSYPHFGIKGASGFDLAAALAG